MSSKFAEHTQHKSRPTRTHNTVIPTNTNKASPGQEQRPQRYRMSKSITRPTKPQALPLAQTTAVRAVESRGQHGWQVSSKSLCVWMCAALPLDHGTRERSANKSTSPPHTILGTEQLRKAPSNNSHGSHRRPRLPEDRRRPRRKINCHPRIDVTRADNGRGGRER